VATWAGDIKELVAFAQASLTPVRPALGPTFTKTFDSLIWPFRVF